MRRPKITFIGAGSVVSARTLISDIISYPALRGSELCLMDIDAERLKVINELARRMASEYAPSMKVNNTLDRREALNGADYVVK